MTSIIGIKLPEKNCIVLGSDSQINIESDDGEFEEKVKAYKKIMYGQNWAIAHSGYSGDDNENKTFERFLGILNGEKKYRSSEEIARRLVEEAIENYEKSVSRTRKSKEEWSDFLAKSHFNLVNLLNTTIMRYAKYKSEDDSIDLTYFLLATCPPKLGLWYVDAHGNLRDVVSFRRDLDYLCLGSGAEKISNYIKNLIDDDKIDSDTITIPETIGVVKGALERAERDPFTGGPKDLIVLDKNGVHYYGDKIKEGLTKAENDIFDEIKQEFSED